MVVHPFSFVASGRLAWRPGPTCHVTARRSLRARKPHRHLRQCCVFSTAEPAQRLKAALRVTQQCRGDRHDGRYDQKRASSNCSNRRAEAAVQSPTDAPRITRPIALTPWQDKRHLRQAKRAPFRLRHDDRIIKGAPHYLSLYPFPFPLSLSCYRDRERAYCEKDPSRRRKWAPSPPTDQGFEGCTLRGSATAPEHSGSEPFTDQGFEGWPLGRVRQPP
jgi:hypothetical protein